ncbi:MAG: helix-turn-helix transcriptional regulator [Nitrosopumilaceae archaeon]|nr:helix-turn-helix transcriptional regulator [Nitrosopumilaceae archaeon]
MNSLDRIIANGVKSVLEEDLGKSTFKKIEKEVYEVYGISVLEAVSDFSKLDLVLRKFFGKYTSNIESKIFKKVFSVGQNTKHESTITIKDPNVAKKIFEAYGDPAKKVILDLLLHESKSIPEAIVESKLPKASTYNRIKELIQDGLLTMVGFTNASDGRKVNEYAATFNKTVFEINDEKISINANVQNKFLRDSFAFSSIQGQ